MNCKPGDLAVIVRDDYTENIGKFVCVQHRSRWEGEPGNPPGVLWECKPHSVIKADYLDERGRRLFASTGLENVDMPDAWLRPIRNPGDDARDETLNWLPAPSRETEAA